MKLRSPTPMRVAKIGYIVMSAFFCVVGILFIANPAVSANAVTLMLGIGMVLFGIVKLVGYFSKDLYRLAFQYDLQFGILLVILGIAVLIKPANVLNLFIVAVGIAIIADGLFKVQMALDSRAFGIGQWWIILALAIAAGAIGLMLVFRPSESLQLLTVLLGVSLLAEGILNFVVAVYTVKIIKNQYPDRIENTETEDMDK